MQGNHVDLGLWTSAEESLSFLCSSSVSLAILYRAIRDRLFPFRKKKVFDELFAYRLAWLNHDRTTRGEAHNNENQATGQTNDSVAIQIEIPAYPPPTYSAVREERVFVRECREQERISKVWDETQERDALARTKVWILHDANATRGKPIDIEFEKWFVDGPWLNFDFEFRFDTRHKREFSHF